MPTPYRSSKLYRSSETYRGTEGTAPNVVDGAAHLTGVGTLAATPTGSGTTVVSGAAHLTGVGTLAATATGLTPPTFPPFRSVTIEELIELERTPIRAAKFRYDVLDPALAKIGTTSVDADQAPTIRNDPSRSIIRTLDGLRVPPGDADELETLRARIRPMMVFSDGTAKSMGVFLFGEASKPRRSWGNELTGSLLDQCFMLDQELGRHVGYAPGARVIDALVALANEVGVYAIRYDASDAVVSTPLAYGPSEHRLKVMQALCTLAGFFPPYFDNAGTLVLRSIPTVLERAELVYDDGTRIVVDTETESDDLLNAPNRYVVVDTNLTDSPVVATFDIPDTYPHSIHNRGVVIPKTIEARGVGNTTVALGIAQAAASADFATHTKVEFSAPIDPRHDTFDVLELRGDPYREEAWSTKLDPTELMAHTARKVFA